MDEGPPQGPELVVAPHTAGGPPNHLRADSSRPTSVESTRSVRSLTSDDVRYVHENGRTYANESYYLPCVYKPDDLEEQDRLSIQHQVFVRALKSRLTTTRLLPSTRRILDLGTGPGQWATAMVRQYPRAEVVGIDLTEWDLDDIEPASGDSEVTWQIDDLDVWGSEIDVEQLCDKLASLDFIAEPTHRNPIDPPKKNPKATTTSSDNVGDQALPVDDALSLDLSTLESRLEPGWHFSVPFELIHMRNMQGCFTHWEEVYTEIYKSLSPGGWIEVADWDLGNVPHAPEACIPPNYPMPMMRSLFAACMEASSKSGRPLGLFYMHPSFLEEVGFTDVQTTHINVPVGQWPDDQEQRTLGKHMLVLLLDFFEPLCLRLLTRWGSMDRVWTAEQVKEDVETAQGEIRDWVERSEQGEVEGWCVSFKWITGKKSWHVA